MGIINNLTGKFGEASIANHLGWSNLFGYRGKILRNVYLPKNDGSTTEIDLLFITQKGIFVIESKNYIGYIFGRDTDNNWTVSVYKGKSLFGRIKTEKHKFYNPIKQNKGHIKWLSSFLNYEVPMFSCIVFSDRGELKSIDISSSTDTIVCNKSDLNRNIRFLWKAYPDVLSEIDVDDIYDCLLSHTNANALLKKQHIESIKEKQSICPVCGKTLVVRTASKGVNIGKSFYGCSGYPQCKYTRNIN